MCKLNFMKVPMLVHVLSKLVHDSSKPTWLVAHQVVRLWPSVFVHLSNASAWFYATNHVFYSSELRSFMVVNLLPLATSWIFLTKFINLLPHCGFCINQLRAFLLFIGSSLFCVYVQTSSLDVDFSLVLHYNTSKLEVGTSTVSV